MAKPENIELSPLLMKPHFSERPWGGRMLRERLGKDTPQDKTIGEAWELSDHPNGKSSIAEGPGAGEQFGEVLRARPQFMIGLDEAPERYPLLIKFIDAAEDLSIQVHPNDEQASRKGDRGKTECWYVMHCEPDSEIIFGLKHGVTPEQLRDGAKDGSIESMICRQRIVPGTFVFVRAGTVHAILGGTLICEIQQSSDTTYRLWDWNRKPARPLHVEESIEVIDWDAAAPELVHLPEVGQQQAPRVLTDNEYFRVQALDVMPRTGVTLPPGLSRSGAAIMCVAGAVNLHGGSTEVRLETGRTVYLPAACEGNGTVTVEGNEPARVLIAESREL